VNQPEPPLKAHSLTVQPEPEVVERMREEAAKTWPPALAALMQVGDTGPAIRAAGGACVRMGSRVVKAVLPARLPLPLAALLQWVQRTALLDLRIGDLIGPSAGIPRSESDPNLEQPWFLEVGSRYVS
jgi:hypothetical protein